MNFTDNLIENAIKRSIEDIAYNIESVLNGKLLEMGLNLYDFGVKQRLTLITNEETGLNSYNLDVIDENNLGTLIMQFKIVNETDLKTNGIKLTLQYL